MSIKIKQHTILPVTNAASRSAFYQTARNLYQHDPVWVCPPDREIEKIFNPKQNILFQNGAAARWILLDGHNRLIGRIAAFYNQKKAYVHHPPTGGIGFFECINDSTAARLLFDTAKNWLIEHKLEAMDGPINFGENENFWGLLVEGFTHPSYGMNYNPPYYQTLFETYGFLPYYTQIAKHLDITRPMPPKWERIAAHVVQKPGVRFENAKRNNLEKYALDFREIYNDAWQFHTGFSPMTEAQAIALVKPLAGIIIEEMTMFAYVNNEPAAVLVCVPDLNQIIKPWRGKPMLWDILLFLWRKRQQFLWYRRKGILNRGRVTVIGVKNKFQQLGLEAAMTILPNAPVRAMGFKEIELSWTGDFNPKVQRLLAATGAAFGKRYITYRYLFDRNRPFEPMATIPIDSKKKFLAQQQGSTDDKITE